MSLKDFKTRLKIRTEPENIYSAFTNPLTIELWSGYPAEMPEADGGEFSMWEGDISGRVLERVPQEKVVEEWFFGDQEEPSIATIKIFPYRSYAQVEVVHTNIPEEAWGDITHGWEEYILGTIKEFFEAE
ncbi:SRPBCC domain-containing protein [Marinilabilia rubra]|uniref:ATPase n=1 Tax=Marinilabilia rubra TaxID=2162893 RepID=A0A2U2BC40_9BACT|nr:SRPBCC domain-containing protein [Marinilabilia rubra]PWE00632.1 ATPase [Marinilabilia rubra]